MPGDHDGVGSRRERATGIVRIELPVLRDRDGIQGATICRRGYRQRDWIAPDRKRTPVVELSVAVEGVIPSVVSASAGETTDTESTTSMAVQTYGDPLCNTVGCNFVNDFGTPLCRTRNLLRL